MWWDFLGQENTQPNAQNAKLSLEWERTAKNVV